MLVIIILKIINKLPKCCQTKMCKMYLRTVSDQTNTNKRNEAQKCIKINVYQKTKQIHVITKSIVSSSG